MTIQISTDRHPAAVLRLITLGLGLFLALPVVLVAIMTLWLGVATGIRAMDSNIDAVVSPTMVTLLIVIAAVGWIIATALVVLEPRGAAVGYGLAAAIYGVAWWVAGQGAWTYLALAVLAATLAILTMLSRNVQRIVIRFGEAPLLFHRPNPTAPGSSAFWAQTSTSKSSRTASTGGAGKVVSG